jgi:hypothetical protein
VLLFCHVLARRSNLLYQRPDADRVAGTQAEIKVGVVSHIFLPWIRDDGCVQAPAPQPRGNDIVGRDRTATLIGFESKLITLPP